MLFSADPPNTILHIISKLEHASVPWISVTFGSCKLERVKTKYMIMSRDQNAGRSYNMKIYNSSIVQIFGNNVNK